VNESPFLKNVLHLADPEREVHRLRQHLVVEHEIVGVLAERKRFQDLPGECPIAGVVIRKLDAAEEILEERQ
jgi:hypothetical protein